MKSTKLLFVLLFLISVSIFSNTNKANIEKLKFLLTTNNLEIEKEFDKSFIKAVPKKQIQEFLGKYKKDLGKIIKIYKSEAFYIVLGETARTKAKIGISKNKIVTLWFGNVFSFKDSKETILNEFKKLSGVKSIYLVKNNTKVLISLNENKALAVGSSFKLYVLKTLEKKIKEGKAKWSSLINLNKDNYSHPSGFLHSWPDKTPMTLRALANLMISISDNTATDALIDYLGRKEIEKISMKNKPFLKTHEMFKIKWGIKADLQEKYLKGDIKTKRNLLKTKIKSFPLKDINYTKIVSPILIDKVEWFFTTKDLAKIIYSLKNNESISINGGLVNVSDWHYVGYKGGSEPGVLNFTILLQKTKTSPIFTLSTTINDTKKAVDKKFKDLIYRLIGLIEYGKL